jgi:hypothetical protein
MPQETNPLWRDGWKTGLTVFAVELGMQITEAERKGFPQRKKLLEVVKERAEQAALQAPRFTR